MTINEEKISIDEFENIFYKNNEDIEITKEYLDEYIDLFINFKLKVKETGELDMTHSLLLLRNWMGIKNNYLNLI